jgi:di/tricarboxylate transporter
MVQGPRADIAALEDARHFRIIQALETKTRDRARAGIAIALFVGALVLGMTHVAPLSVAVLGGAVLTFLTGCITPEQAYRELEWSAVILIGSMLALGVAMDQTGTARYLASLIVDSAGGLGPRWLLAAFFVLTVVLTQVMSNQAAAVVVLPIALATAAQLGFAGRPFAMLIAIAASCSYLTPLEPSCLLVYGPGGYKFSDFPRFGGVLTLIIGAMAVAGVPLLWPV